MQCIRTPNLLSCHTNVAGYSTARKCLKQYFLIVLFFNNRCTFCEVKSVSQTLYWSNIPLLKAFYSFQPPYHHSGRHYIIEVHGTFGCSVGPRRNCLSHQLTISLFLHHLTVSSQSRSSHDILNCHCRSAEGSVVTSCLLWDYPKFQSRFQLNRIAMLVLPVMFTLKPYITVTTC